MARKGDGKFEKGCHTNHCVPALKNFFLSLSLNKKNWVNKLLLITLSHSNILIQIIKSVSNMIRPTYDFNLICFIHHHLTPPPLPFPSARSVPISSHPVVRQILSPPHTLKKSRFLSTINDNTNNKITPFTQKPSFVSERPFLHQSRISEGWWIMVTRIPRHPGS